MTVEELIQVLKEFPAGTEVVMGVVAPVEDEDEDDDELVVDLVTIDAVRLRADDESGDPLVWLIGGDDDDVDLLLSELDEEADDEG